MPFSHPSLSTVFVERIMSDALEEHGGKDSIGCRNFANLRFADDTDALAEKDKKLEALLESLDNNRTKYKIGDKC